ncbi:MAG: cupin domain-containing protein [Pseudomonadota bacterium]
MARNKSDNTNDAQLLGSRLARVRQSFGLSQRQLSKVSGVANATISQIEKGQLNPTVGTLRKLLSGLPMTLSAFFDEDAPLPNEKLFFKSTELSEISEGLVSYKQVGHSLSGKAIQFMWEKYEPGADTGRHALTHEGEECGFIIRGELKVTVAGQSKVLRAGDAYYFNSDQPHSFKNEGTAVCELITACTPPSF